MSGVDKREGEVEPFTVWLTGLPCSGKTTLGQGL